MVNEFLTSANTAGKALTNSTNKAEINAPVAATPAAVRARPAQHLRRPPDMITASKDSCRIPHSRSGTRRAV